MERTWCLSCETKDMVVLLVFLFAGCCLYFVNKQRHTVIGPFIVLIPTGCPSPPSVLSHENLVHSQGSLLPWFSGFGTAHTEQKRHLHLYRAGAPVSSPPAPAKPCPGSWARWWGFEALSQEPGEIACLTVSEAIRTPKGNTGWCQLCLCLWTEVEKGIY